MTVTADVPLLQTETMEQSTTLESKSMSQLPQVTQDWENFMILIPGATGTPGGIQGSSNPGQEVAINGNLPYSNILADGASTTLSHSQNANPAVFETVSELQINTSAFSAQYGVGGVIFNQISQGRHEPVPRIGLRVLPERRVDRALSILPLDRFRSCATTTSASPSVARS